MTKITHRFGSSLKVNACSHKRQAGKTLYVS